MLPRLVHLAGTASIFIKVQGGVYEFRQEEFFDLISEPKDRGWLFYLARQMFFGDNEFCDYEKMAYEKLHVKHMSSINLPGILAEVKSIEADESQVNQAPGEMSGAFQHFVEAIRKLLG